MRSSSTRRWAARSFCVVLLGPEGPDLLRVPQGRAASTCEELLGITDRFGGIDKAKAQKLGYEVLPGDAWIEQPVDILIPAALENQIRADNVQRVHGKVRRRRGEAHHPRSRRGPEENGVFMIPDFLANAGGVTCSYFEQVQSNMNYYWEKDEVLARLDSKMTSAFHAVHELATKRELFMRDAAYVIAINRVAQACGIAAGCSGLRGAVTTLGGASWLVPRTDLRCAFRWTVTSARWRSGSGRRTCCR